MTGASAADELGASILRNGALQADALAILAEKVASDLQAAGIEAPGTTFFADNRRALARTLRAHDRELIVPLTDEATELAARIEAAAERLRKEFHAPLYVGSRAMTAVTEVLTILDGLTDGADQ